MLSNTIFFKFKFRLDDKITLTNTFNNFLGNEGTSPDNTESYSCKAHCEDIKANSKDFFPGWTSRTLHHVLVNHGFFT